MWLESKLGCFPVLSIPSKSILLCDLKILVKLLKSTVNPKHIEYICIYVSAIYILCALV